MDRIHGRPLEGEIDEPGRSNGKPKLPPLQSHIGESVKFKGTVRGDVQGRVIDEVAAEDHPGKVVKVQLIEFPDERRIFRLCYWIEGKKPSVIGKWMFGQFAPTISIPTWVELLRQMTPKGWLDSNFQEVLQTQGDVIEVDPVTGAERVAPSDPEAQFVPRELLKGESNDDKV